MADKAFDAFSQRRDTGTKARVKDTKVVETATDPNRYRLPPNRRVRVVADQLDMTVDPEKSKLLSLAEGLNKVKPKLLKAFTEQSVDENMEQVDLGRQAAMTQTPGELKKLQDKIDNKWFQFGAGAESAYKAGEDLSVKLALDMENRPRNISYDEAYQAWWQENQPTNIDPQFLGTFNNSFRPNANKVKNQDIKRDYELNRAKAIAMSSKTVIDTLMEAHANEANIFAALDALKANEQALYHFDNATWNEVKFFAVTTAADNLDDPALLEVFNKSTFDQVTGQEVAGMAYTGTWGEKIRGYKEKLIRDNKREENEEARAAARVRADKKLIDTENYKALRMTIGDDGILSQVLGTKATQIRARGWLTVQDYKAIIKELEAENDPDGTPTYEDIAEIRKVAYDRAVANATAKNWSNDVLTKEQNMQALVQKDNDVALNNMVAGDNQQGKQDLIKYYKYQKALKSGEPVPEELIYALPFEPTKEQQDRAYKMGMKESQIFNLQERKKILEAQNSNIRSVDYDSQIKTLTSDIDLLEAQQEQLANGPVKDEKTDVESVKKQVTKDANAEFPEIEDRYISDGGITNIARIDPAGYARYTKFKKDALLLKDVEAGKAVDKPKDYESWDDLRAHLAKEREYYEALSKRRAANKQ